MLQQIGVQHAISPLDHSGGVERVRGWFDVFNALMEGGIRVCGIRSEDPGQNIYLAEKLFATLNDRLQRSVGQSCEKERRNR
jgi:hypothetical protein